MNHKDVQLVIAGPLLGVISSPLTCLVAGFAVARIHDFAFWPDSLFSPTDILICLFLLNAPLLLIAVLMPSARLFATFVMTFTFPGFVVLELMITSPSHHF